MANNSETRPVMLTEEERRIISDLLREKAEAEDAAALLEEDDRYSLGHADHVASAYKYRILALKIEEVANV